MSRVIIRTFAYNAEKTIERTIKSIMSQTHMDFIWYVINNGSTDSTGKIIESYAKKDKRIRVIKNNINRTDTEYTIGVFYDILSKYDDTCYFCTIDADDFYHSRFLEEMLYFIKENNLDIAACSSVFLKEDKNQILGARKIQQELIITDEVKERYYTVYHQFTRTIWGKVFSFSVLRKCNFEKIKEISYGNDTYFTTEAFRNALRIGISDKVLHQYYMHERSVSFMVDKKRLNSSKILLEQGIDYLKKYGQISSTNMMFLFYVYYHSIKDTILCVLTMQRTSKEILDICHIILMAEYTKIIIPLINRDEIINLQNHFAEWICKNEMDFIVIHRKQILDCLSVLCMNSDLVSYISKKKSDIFIFYIRCLEKCTEDLEKKQLQIQIKSLLREDSLASMFTTALWIMCQDVIKHILDEDYDGAWRIYNRILEEETLKVDKEVFIRVGQFLAALLENENSYILLKKIMISLLIESGKNIEAIEELEDFDVLLPQDTEFAEFRKILSLCKQV